ncbi:hypothetical protein NST07_28630 [Paenibacillus sp. FSL L8-0340]|uniref:hypothetical protein n=1 Tax=Paenibacillus sp. FSL L8-0340 TaxID=2954685 RepID=UPI0031594E29
MTALKTLVQLEYSRFSPSRQGKSKSILIGLSLFCVMVLVGMYLPATRATQRSPFIFAALLLWTVTLGLSTLHILAFQGQQHREWFLSFPHSRLTLLYAKVASLLKHSLNITFLVMASAIAVYALSALAGRYAPLPAVELIYTLASYTLFIIATLPLAVVWGLAITLLMRARKAAVLLVIPYNLLWLLPLIYAGLLSSSTLGLEGVEYASPNAVLMYALALILIGWPFCYFLMPLIARNGLGAMGELRSTALPSSANSRWGKNAKINTFTIRKAPFTTLYRLHTSRVQRIEKHPVIVTLKLAVPLLIIAAGYYGSTDGLAIQSVSRALFMMPVLFGFLWMMSRSSLERKQLPWLLGLPQSRLTVLLAGVAAVWVTVMRIIIVLALSAIAGSIIGLITGKTDPHNLSYALTWLLFSFLLYTLTLTLTLGLMQAEYYLMKSSALSLLLLPIVLLGTLHSVLINRFMIPEDIHSGMMPDWSLLGWIAAIGLPLAACCIFAGAKYYHLILTPQKKAAAQTKQA